MNIYLFFVGIEEEAGFPYSRYDLHQAIFPLWALTSNMLSRRL
jgi:hypothetical protein